MQTVSFETVCMKYQILFSQKNKQIIFQKVVCWNFYPVCSYSYIQKNYCIFPINYFDRPEQTVSTQGLHCLPLVQQLLDTASHYKTTPIQINRKFHLQKWKIFRLKLWYIFHISAQSIDCGYSLEPPRRGGSNEYPHLCFWAERRKIMYTPVNPSFTI